jgi:hypothetical protein
VAAFKKMAGWLSYKDNRRNNLKTKLIMRISSVFVLISLTCVNLCAKNVEAQQISVSTKDAPIEKVFELIQKESGYEFFYDARQIKNAKRVTMNFKNAELKAVLDHCFHDQPFGYSIQNKTIVLTQPTHNTANASCLEESF